MTFPAGFQISICQFQYKFNRVFSQHENISDLVTPILTLYTSLHIGNALQVKHTGLSKFNKLSLETITNLDQWALTMVHSRGAH